jgi:predicted lipoprotein
MFLCQISILFFVCFSCHFERLDEAQKNRQQAEFNPQRYAEEFWQNKLLRSLDRAVDVEILLNAIATDKNQAKHRYGRTVGIGDVYYYFVSGEGVVVEKTETNLMIDTADSGQQGNITIPIDFIFGNAIRNGSGLIDVNDFPNSQDFNNVSAEINRMVTAEVIAPVIERIEKGKTVGFVGCAEIMDEETDLNPMTVVPVELEVR